MHLDPQREPTQPAQVLLRLHYQQLLRAGGPFPDFADVEFGCYSQNGEDGILLYLFSLIGTETRRAVEVCCGEGIECNAANLVVNHGWDALLLDGDAAKIAAGKAFYAKHRNTFVSPPTLASSWIDAENINALVSGHGFAGEVDMLSLDMDGNDYWVLKALTCVRPRVIVLEFNALLGPEKRLSLPYDPSFRWDFSRPGPPRCGASLAAFTDLCRSRDYRLVGVQSLGFNAFFVRNGIADDILPERTPLDCYQSTPRLRTFGQPWLDVMFAENQAWQEV